MHMYVMSQFYIITLLYFVIYCVCDIIEKCENVCDIDYSTPRYCNIGNTYFEMLPNTADWKFSRLFDMHESAVC